MTIESAYAAHFLLETHMNDLPQRQKFSGAARDRRRGAGHQQESARPRISRKARRREGLPGLRQQTEPVLQDPPLAEVEEGSHRPDDGAAESHTASDSRPRIQGRVRLRQGAVSVGRSRGFITKGTKNTETHGVRPVGRASRGDVGSAGTAGTRQASLQLPRGRQAQSPPRVPVTSALRDEDKRQD